MFKLLKSGLCVAVLSLSGAVTAHEFHEHEEDSNTLAKISLVDQFDNKQTLDETTKVLIFAHDMSGNDIVEEAFASFDADKLKQLNAIYLADISGMPSLIAKWFALPAMRDRAYPIMLDKEGDATSKLHAKEDQVTVIFLDKLAIQKVKYAATAAELNQLLKP